MRSLAVFVGHRASTCRKYRNRCSRIALGDSIDFDVTRSTTAGPLEIFIAPSGSNLTSFPGFAGKILLMKFSPRYIARNHPLLKYISERYGEQSPSLCIAICIAGDIFLSMLRATLDAGTYR